MKVHSYAIKSWQSLTLHTHAFTKSLMLLLCFSFFSASFCFSSSASHLYVHMHKCTTGTHPPVLPVYGSLAGMDLSVLVHNWLMEDLIVSFNEAQSYSQCQDYFDK